MLQTHSVEKLKPCLLPQAVGPTPKRAFNVFAVKIQACLDKTKTKTQKPYKSLQVDIGKDWGQCPSSRASGTCLKG